MSYNRFGSMPYGPPPGFPSFPRAGVPGEMAPRPGLGPPPGMSMSSAPGMAPPPGLQPASTTQTNRPGGLPPTFQPPANLPNINFNASVIRLGTISAKSSTPTSGHRRDSDLPFANGGRAGLGSDRGDHGGRAAAREAANSLFATSNEEKLRTIFICKLPKSLDDADMQRMLSAMGTLRRWDSAASVLEQSPIGLRFGFATFDDTESVVNALELLKDVDLPLEKSSGGQSHDHDTSYDSFDKIRMQLMIDSATQRYLDHWKEEGDVGRDKAELARNVESSRVALQEIVRSLFCPEPSALPVVDDQGDAIMSCTEPMAGNVEVVNISLAQDDELADIPAEMREVVTAEIASFRDRSNRRDLERLKREEELVAGEQARNVVSHRPPRVDHSPSRGAASDSPNANRARGPLNPPSGPKVQNGRIGSGTFVNGSSSGLDGMDLSAGGDDDRDANLSDEELHNRRLAQQKAEDDDQYFEAEKKWLNRERSRAAALAREQDRELQEAKNLEQRREEQLNRERTWDDDKEATRKSAVYYYDHAVWLKKRMADRTEEEARDEADRRAEDDERRREQADLERAKGLANSFLDQQAEEVEQQHQQQQQQHGFASAGAGLGAGAGAAALVQQPFKLSLGAAAQRAQRPGLQRRTVADVEGLLDDEEQGQTGRRQLVPIQYEPANAAQSMTDEEISAAVRALAQEIPSDRDALWSWDVQWDHMDDAVVREKLRPFVEKKIMEYLGVQEQMLVHVVEEHLVRHGNPGALVEELAEALDDDAEDLVKKLWRMVIFFTESEKRGLPA